MNIGIKLWSTNLDYYAKEALRLYEKGYFSYIELYAVPGTLETASEWKSLNIPYTLHCPHFAHGFNLGKSELRESNSKIFDEVRRFADLLNVDYIIIHGGIGGEVEETAKQLKSLNEPRALIENKPYKAVPVIAPGKICVGYSPEQIGLIKSVSGCGFCLDFNHAICTANSFKFDYIEYLKKFMALKPDMFHLSDLPDEKTEYDGHLHLGQGKLNLKSLIQFMNKDSKVSLETAKNSRTSLDDFISDSDWVTNASL